MTVQTQAPPRLHTLAEAAKKAGIPLKTLQAGCRAETITHVSFGGRRYMTDDHIAELIAKHTVSAEQAAAADPDDADRARVARLASMRAGT